MKDLHLCSIPYLDTSYTNVIDFENAENREEFFINQTKKTVRTNFKYDNNRAFIVVNGNFRFFLYDTVNIVANIMEFLMYSFIWYSDYR